MGNQMSQITFNLTISDELFDSVFIYKLFNNPNLLESLKCIEKSEVFTSLEAFCINELKVCLVISNVQCFIKCLILKIEFLFIG